MFLLILLIIVSGLQCKIILLLNLYHHEIWLGIHSFTGEPIFGGGLILQSGDRVNILMIFQKLILYIDNMKLILVPVKDEIKILIYDF